MISITSCIINISITIINNKFDMDIIMIGIITLQDNTQGLADLRDAVNYIIKLAVNCLEN